ncbi:MAG TPA: hypothetical protein ENJ50_07090 [Planctomycetaceae bacterium]|nr:hypothetical protein [Planctomycetaceae bacterium]
MTGVRFPCGIPEIEGSGFLVKSLEAALRAVDLGDDADTTGALCGQLAGAHWGESTIPSEWRDGLAKRELIDAALTGLVGREVE